MENKEKGPGWITGWLAAGMGFVPVISTRLSFEDILGGIRVRRVVVVIARYGVANPLEGVIDIESPVMIDRLVIFYVRPVEILRTCLPEIKAESRCRSSLPQ